MKWTIILLPVVCVALYLLYQSGYIVTQMKNAVKYIESKKGTKASFSHCTGFTRRRVNFQEDKVYHFVFLPELTKGELSAEILDASKSSILCLNDSIRSADIELEQKRKYYLVFRFQSASGKYALSWK